MMYSNITTHRCNNLPDKALKILVSMVLGIVFSSGVLLFLFEIDLMNYLPSVSLCPFHAITGLPCPGCGMTRAFLRLGQLKLLEAIEFNLFSTPLLILMTFYISPIRFPSFLRHEAFSIIMLIVVILVWLMRLSVWQVIW